MKVAQYCQWDGYPSGQGLTILNFLSGNPSEDDKHTFSEGFKYGIKGLVFDRDLFVANIRACTTFKNDEELLEFQELCLSECDGDQEKVADKYPHLCRNIGGHLLAYIQKNGPLKLSIDTEFVGDSLFCEWAYVIDLDTDKFEVYKGFQKEPNTDRFAEWFVPATGDHTQFYPVALMKSWSLDDLPSFDEFLKELRDEED
jgi:hypothetical protein